MQNEALFKCEQEFKEQLQNCKNECLESKKREEEAYKMQEQIKKQLQNSKNECLESKKREEEAYKMIREQIESEFK